MQCHSYRRAYVPVLKFSQNNERLLNTREFTIKQLVIAWSGRPALTVCKHCLTMTEANDGHQFMSKKGKTRNLYLKVVL